MICANGRLGLDRLRPEAGAAEPAAEHDRATQQHRRQHPHAARHAVEQRQRRVDRVNRLEVDHAHEAERGADRLALGGGDALGRAGGAGSEAHGGDIEEVDGNARVRAVFGQFGESHDMAPALRRVGGIPDDHQRFHGRAEFRRKPLDHGQEFGVHHPEPGAADRELGCQQLADQAGVDPDVGGTAQVQREPRQHEVGAVGQHQRHEVAVPDAEPGEAARQRVRPPAGLGEGEPVRRAAFAQERPRPMRACGESEHVRHGASAQILLERVQIHCWTTPLGDIWPHTYRGAWRLA